jgi:hypothetical protein
MRLGRSPKMRLALGHETFRLLPQSRHVPEKDARQLASAPIAWEQLAVTMLLLCCANPMQPTLFTFFFALNLAACLSFL